MHMQSRESEEESMFIWKISQGEYPSYIPVSKIKPKHFVIKKHLKDEHNLRLANLCENFKILKKSWSKLECLIFEMLMIRKKRPKLNTQRNSICAKLFKYLHFHALFTFIYFFSHFHFCIYVCHLIC